MKARDALGFHMTGSPGREPSPSYNRYVSFKLLLFLCNGFNVGWFGDGFRFAIGYHSVKSLACLSKGETGTVLSEPVYDGKLDALVNGFLLMHLIADADMEDYGFEYSDEEPEEQDVDIENQYYNTKGVR